jgi:dihydrodipicolinate synthase/N-acetylneuraminate lyase
MDKIQQKRVDLIKRLFPNDFPKLWCPSLTFYNEKGSIDFDRMSSHLDYLLPYINSYLIPGSTGDGWELSFDEFKQLLEFAFKRYNPDSNINITIGILRTNMDEMLEFMDYAADFLKDIGLTVNSDDYRENRFKGFVICSPKGRNTTQKDIENSLSRFLDMNYPTILYQLPQVTENETSPETLDNLVREYYNLYMVKDSSGYYTVAKEEIDYNNLFLVRGVEVGYSEALKKSGGFYDGFLLSTGNSFPKELKEIITLLEMDNQHDADELSHKLTLAINEVFEIAKDIKTGSLFTNANKMIEHIRRYGKDWVDKPLPRLHSGETISKESLKKTEAILKKHNLSQM